MQNIKYNIDKKVNKFLLAGFKSMLEVYLKQPRFV